MAGTLLHITIATTALDRAEIPAGLRQQIAATDDFRLGAVLVDLPYFEHLLLNGIRLLLKRDVRFNIWGLRLHLHSPTRLCRELFRRARDLPARAMALGALTHLAVDTLFHEEIERRVSAIGSPNPNALHKTIEDQVDLHSHRHLLGHPGMGTPYARERLRLAPHPTWTARFSAALLAVYKEAPPAPLLERWLRGLALFGAMHASPRLPWVETVPKEDADLRDTAVALADRAVALSQQYIEIGVAEMESPRDPPLTEIPERNLVDGGAAKP